MALSPSIPRKFTFDTVFDGERVVAPVRPKQAFSPQEVEAARAEGFDAGQRSAVAQAETQAAQALADVSQAIRLAFGHLAEVAHAHRSDSAGLALACGRAIADAALDRFPEAPALAALTALARELDGQPRLLVRAGPGELDRLRDSLDAAAQQAGFAGAVVVKADATLPRAGFAFDWGDGRAAFDPAEASQRVEAALAEALVAEALHAEPPILSEAP